MHCDPCLSEHVEKPALSHCEECNESFCESCSNFHNKIKLGKTHTLRNIGSIPSQKDRNFLNTLKSCACSDQKVKPVEYFCNDHGEFCCAKCHIKKHKKCDNVDEIDGLIDRDNSKTFDAPLGVLQEKIQELTKISAGNTQLVEESYTAVEKRLVEVKQAIDDAYNELKTKILSEAKTRKKTLISEIQQHNQNIETLSIKLNEQRSNAETVIKYGTDNDKYIFGHSMETSSLKEMKSTESSIRSSLIPRQFTTKEKHSVADIVMKLKEAIELVDKELITGSDSHDSTGLSCQKSVKPKTNRSTSIARSAGQKKQATPVVLSLQEQFHRMKEGTRVVRGPDWRHGEEDGGPGGLGTVVYVYAYGDVSVRWDYSGKTCHYYMRCEGPYPLQLAD